MPATCYQACAEHHDTLSRQPAFAGARSAPHPNRLKRYRRTASTTEQLDKLAWPRRRCAPDDRADRARRADQGHQDHSSRPAAAVRREVSGSARAGASARPTSTRTTFAECRQLVADLELQECVQFTGHGATSRNSCRESMCVVLTSLSEAQPLVLLEAGAAGIPMRGDQRRRLPGDHRGDRRTRLAAGAGRLCDGSRLAAADVADASAACCAIQRCASAWARRCGAACSGLLLDSGRQASYAASIADCRRAKRARCGEG